jgi:magnesium chelatase accessory protein
MNTPATLAALNGAHGPLDWARDGPHWPHAERSRFVDAAGLRWHMQEWEAREAVNPEAPTHLVLLHGTGASTHSWRDLAPLLAASARTPVLALDLPGHGFTPAPSGDAEQVLLPDGTSASVWSLPGMAQAVAVLLQTLGVLRPVFIGHSAGAAIAIQMVLQGQWGQGETGGHPPIVALNPALLPMSGWAGPLFSPVAKLLATSTLVPQWFSRRAASPEVLQRLIDGTGSQLDPLGMALYGRLVRSPEHAAGALRMMANWDLGTLSRQLRQLRAPLHLVVGSNDKTVNPVQAQRVGSLLPPGARLPVVTLAGLGHLAHEEAPERVAAVVAQALR